MQLPFLHTIQLGIMLFNNAKLCFEVKIFLGNNSLIILITAREHHVPNSDGQEAAQQRKILFKTQKATDS